MTFAGGTAYWFAGLVLSYLAANLAVPDGGPLHGVYAVRGRWYALKYLIIRWLLWRRRERKYTIKRRTMNYRLMKEKMREVCKMDSFDGHEKGQNSLYINGCNRKGSTRIVVRISILPYDQREVWFLLRLPGIGDLVLPGHPDCLVDNVQPGEGFRGAGLSCTPIEPMRTWRIAFNGLCRVGIRPEFSEEDNRPLVHVRCTLLWSTFTTFYDFDTDVNLGLTSDYIAKEKWTRQFITNCLNMRQGHYAQFGMIHGTVQVDDQEEMSLLMRGVKERLIGEQQLHDMHSQISNYIVLENGSSIYANASCRPGHLSSETSGFMVKTVGDVISASSVDLPLPVLMENADEIPKNYTFSLNLESGSRLDVQVNIEDTIYFNMGDDWCLRLGQGLSRFTVNGVQGWGVCQTLKRNKGGRPMPARKSVPKLYREPVSEGPTNTALVIPLTARSCQISELTGGKGSQLAKLVSLRDQIPTLEYEVPSGFCVTTVSFKKHLQLNMDLQEAVKELREVSGTVRKGDLKESCERAVGLFTKTTPCSKVKDEIAAIFTKLYGESQGFKTYAVRSSAVGEDSSQTSAAGQMETFLGMNSLEMIFEAIQKCWASNFSFQAVQYRRQYGQPVDAFIAVVVQEMVPADSAGVAFSRDPMTGNPSKIVINSNYGLGESVVSGVTEVDTVTLNVDGSKKLTIADRKIGSKEEAMTVAEGGGTQTTRQTDTKAAACSAKDELCLKLGRIALKMDECFSDARDIEWASVGDKVYLLQARSITTFDLPSRYELLHEFDSGLPMDRIWLTTGNIQEMCPGALSTLTRSHFVDGDMMDQVSSIKMRKRAMSYPAMRSVISAYNQVFFSQTNSISTMLRISNISDNVDGVFFGEAIDAECIREARELNEPLLSRWTQFYNMFKSLLKLRSNRKLLEREFARDMTHMSERWETAQEQYDDIYMYPDDRAKSLTRHARETFKSAIMQNIVGSLISKYSEGQVVFTHIAQLLSSCPDVESANVPLAMENVAKAILKEGKSDMFQKLTPVDALEWLRSPSSGGAGQAFSIFTQRHGHRCVREVELRDKSWSMDPLQVIPTLQAILASNSHMISQKKRVLSAAEAVDQLGLPFSILHRKLLNYFVAKAREGVAARESSKSKFIRINQVMKEAYWRLANLMVREGRLPDEDLLFFFTYDEIGRLLQDRSPALIARALRRRRILPEQNAQQFERVIVGRPQPISEEEDFRAEFKLEGTPISQGIVKGTARVVTDFKDAKNIQKGDILITRITDIGWSPYFPLLSGLVTEIGGVLSHGAVVAREYGIPCVVNVQKATSVFKTGDTVIMDGSKGTLEKIETTTGFDSSTEAPPTSDSCSNSNQ